MDGAELSPALGSSCGASSRSIFGRWQQCFVFSAGLVICAAKYGCCDAPRYEFLWYPTVACFFGARDASVASLDRSVALGRRTFNQLSRARAAGPSYGPRSLMSVGVLEGMCLVLFECLCCYLCPFLPARDRASHGAGGGSSRARRAAWAGPPRIPA